MFTQIASSTKAGVKHTAINEDKRGKKIRLHLLQCRTVQEGTGHNNLKVRLIAT
jgi:hypothetical protein